MRACVRVCAMPLAVASLTGYSMEGKGILVLCGIVLAALRTAGMPLGAPTSACDTFTPNHTGYSPQTGDGGFKLYSSLIDNGGSYEGNQVYTSKPGYSYIYISTYHIPAHNSRATCTCVFLRIYIYTQLPYDTKTVPRRSEVF